MDNIIIQYLYTLQYRVKNMIDLACILHKDQRTFLYTFFQ